MPTYVAKIPNPLPEIYNDFYQEWKNWVSTLHGKPLFIGVGTTLPTPQGNKPGYIIKAPLPQAVVTNWLPASWVIDITSQSQQINPCDCSSRKLFQQGCPGH